MSKAPGRTLGEEQAYRDGVVRGRTEALLAVAGGLGRVLLPGDMVYLSGVLLDQLKAATDLTTHTSSDAPDATEPEAIAGSPVCPECNRSIGVVFIKRVPASDIPTGQTPFVWECPRCPKGVGGGLRFYGPKPAGFES